MTILELISINQQVRKKVCFLGKYLSFSNRLMGFNSPRRMCDQLSTTNFGGGVQPLIAGLIAGSARCCSNWADGNPMGNRWFFFGGNPRKPREILVWHGEKILGMYECGGASYPAVMYGILWYTYVDLDLHWTLPKCCDLYNNHKCGWEHNMIQWGQLNHRCLGRRQESHNQMSLEESATLEADGNRMVINGDLMNGLLMFGNG